MDLAEYERLNPCCELTWEGVKVAYATPNQATRWRVETLFTKEPVTIDWMTRLGPTLELLAADVLPPPTHIKVDVDGFEHKVFAGAARALRDERLRSLLVEVNQNLEPHRTLVRELEGLGFRWDRSQVEAAERREGPFKGVAEYVFRR